MLSPLALNRLTFRALGMKRLDRLLFVLQLSSGDLSLVAFSSGRTTFSPKQLSGFTPSRKARGRGERDRARNFYEDILLGSPDARIFIQNHPEYSTSARDYIIFLAIPLFYLSETFEKIIFFFSTVKIIPIIHPCAF